MALYFEDIAIKKIIWNSFAYIFRGNNSIGDNSKLLLNFEHLLQTLYIAYTVKRYTSRNAFGVL